MKKTDDRLIPSLKLSIGDLVGIWRQNTQFKTRYLYEGEVHSVGKHHIDILVSNDIDIENTFKNMKDKNEQLKFIAIPNTSTFDR